MDPREKNLGIGLAMLVPEARIDYVGPAPRAVISGGEEHEQRVALWFKLGDLLTARVTPRDGGIPAYR